MDPGGLHITTVYTYSHPSTSDLLNLQQVRDPEGQVTQYTYDVFGGIATTKDAAGETWTYEVDDARRLVKMTAPTFNSQTRETVYTPDDLGRLVELTRDGDTESWSYTPFGAVASYTDFADSTWSFDYDLDRLLTFIDHPDNSNDPGAAVGDATLTWNDSGFLTQLDDENGTTTYAYDAANRMVERARDGYTVTYAYNAANYVTSIDYWGQGTVTYDYYDNSELETLQAWDAPSATATPGTTTICWSRSAAPTASTAATASTRPAA